jgi:hypothetical protein
MVPWEIHNILVGKLLWKEPFSGHAVGGKIILKFIIEK